jgi:hypothetical protein
LEEGCIFLKQEEKMGKKKKKKEAEGEATEECRRHTDLGAKTYID